MQKIYIGEGKREEIHHIKGRIPVEKLTATAGNTLAEAVDVIVTAQEQIRRIFQQSSATKYENAPVRTLTWFGKKHMWEVLNARKEKNF